MAEEGKVQKQRVLALAALGLLFVILLLLIWWWWGRQQEAPIDVTTAPQVNEKVTLTPQKQVVTTNVNTGTAPLSEGELEIRNLARNFAERYGSFSTESDYQNLVDLLPRVTAQLRAEFERMRAVEINSAEFKGYSTKVIAITINSLTNAQAAVVVSTQRVETNHNLQESVFYQDLELTMVREGEFWFVDSATWVSR